MDREILLQGMDTRYALFGTFFAFHNRLQTTGDAFYEEITCKQFFLIICLELFGENAPTIKELAEVMGSSHQNVKQIVDKLERSGFVKMQKDKKDKRKIRICSTEKLESLGEKYKEKSQKFIERFYTGISEEELETVYKVMTRLEENLVEMKEEIK